MGGGDFPLSVFAIFGRKEVSEGVKGVCNTPLPSLYQREWEKLQNYIHCNKLEFFLPQILLIVISKLCLGST